MGVSFEVVDLANRIDYPTQTSRKQARAKGERKKANKKGKLVKWGRGKREATGKKGKCKR